ncbi:MAG: hypothetical protein IJG15_08300, partial [Lachnospiraceae bacterium]|nr:hypothetical protein [Lachnospiraceae bacterium]
METPSVLTGAAVSFAGTGAENIKSAQILFIRCASFDGAEKFSPDAGMDVDASEDTTKANADVNTNAGADKDAVTESDLLAFFKKIRTAVRKSASERGEDRGARLALFAQKEQMPLWGIDGREEFRDGIRMEGIEDLLVCCYLVNPLKNDYEIEDAANEYLGISLQSRKQLFGKASWAQAMRENPDEVVNYACRAADALRRIAPLVREKLADQEMWQLYTEIERPLTFILADMERLGVRIQPEALRAYSERLGGRIDELEQQIYQETGATFNIASPKQLGEVLFERMGLPGGKKTKTGYSTAAGVLEKLAPDYPVVNDILEYRGLTKLRSTYADGLMAYVA